MERAPPRRRPILADLAAEVTVATPTRLGTGYRDYERHRVEARDADGALRRHERDILRCGRVAAVLAVDVDRDELVLIRQFRLAAHLAIGAGDLVEVVAGNVEPGESPEDAARRECREEIGVSPDALVELFSFMPTPGLIDEVVTLFVATVDASQVPQRTGTQAEQEEISTLRVPIADALARLASGAMHNGLLIIALQWLALNLSRLKSVLQDGRSS
jgi:ADP-ribose pyrophosphatase